MLDTPISDLIEAIAEDDDLALQALFDALLDTQLAIQLENLPERVIPGVPFRSEPDDFIAHHVRILPDGRKMIKVGADPLAYSVNFPKTMFNAQVDGRQLLRMIRASENIDGALVFSARTERSVSIGRTTIHALLELSPEQRARRATARAHALRVRELPRWHVEQAAAIGFLDYVVGMLVVAGVAWIAARIAVAAQGISRTDIAATESEEVADMVRLGVTVIGWLGVTVYVVMLTSRRAFAGFHERAMIRLTQFILTFEIAGLLFGPLIVDSVAGPYGYVLRGGTLDWFYALAELLLHPYVLAGCVVALPLIVPRVMKYERSMRSRAKATAQLPKA